jgi:hypothetical protein
MINKKHLPVISIRQRTILWMGYARMHILAQWRAVFFIVAYLIFFQIVMLGILPTSWWTLSSGILAVIVGLAFFLEGVNLSIMPLSQLAGSVMTSRLKPLLSVPLATILGMVATMAEPSVGLLRTAGASIDSSKLPFFASFLNDNIHLLVMSLALGVGLSIALGTWRSQKGISLKTLLIFLLPSVFFLSFWAYLNEQTRPLIGLAWDAGGMVTGPITVSLMIAFGLGVSSASKNSTDQSSGLGLVTLATLLPVLMVLMMGLMAFYRPQWVNHIPILFNQTTPVSQDTWWLALRSHIGMALQAVLPLVGLLFTLIILLQYKLPRLLDEKLLGILFVCLGTLLFNIGVKAGLSPLGEQVGNNLPSFIEPSLHDRGIMLDNFDNSLLSWGLDAKGERHQFFYYTDKDRVVIVPFASDHYNAETKTYFYQPNESLFHQALDKSVLGFGIILLFGFFLGLTATMAEPTLRTLAHTLEDLTAGVMQPVFLVRLVATGVGIGLSLGILRLLIDLPFIYFLVPLYVLIFLVTLGSNSEFVEIAWDAAGVTTGPITIPLVLMVQMSLGNQLNRMDTFGIIALSGAMPILMVLGAGVWLNIHEKRQITVLGDK